MGHPNEDAVREFLQAVSARDLDKAGRDLTDDAVWHVPGSHSLSGDKKGREEILRTLGEFLERTSVQPEMHDVLANDEHVVLMVRRQIGGEDAPAVVVFHAGDGKISEIWHHEANQAAVDRALA